jgi:hypothetical protein
MPREIPGPRPPKGALDVRMAELKSAKGKSSRLSPKELGLLADELKSAANRADVARLRKSLTRGFYGV